jgi:hypothetical protein
MTRDNAVEQHTFLVFSRKRIRVTHSTKQVIS